MIYAIDESRALKNFRTALRDGFVDFSNLIC